MSSSSWTAAVLMSAAAFLARVPTGDGHVYMMTPVSRNLWATTAFQEQGFPDMNHCPHCFQSRGPAAVRARGGGAPWPHFNGERAENGNYIESEEVAKRHGICGDPEQTAAEGSNLYGRENSHYPVLETYAEGGILEVKIVVSTYHWGHVEMFLCDAGDLPDGPDSPVTQSCFNKYPLDRDEDDDAHNPIDPANRGRFILDPACRAQETDQDRLPGAFYGDVATARFRLPTGVTCSRCVVQMVYYTGNSCMHQGYSEFNPPSWPGSCGGKEAWINEGVGYCGDGDAYPEEFWNCADVEITSDGGPGQGGPSPGPSPREEEKKPEYEEPKPAPVDAPEPAYPVDEPTGDCEDPVDAYEQCGGDDYQGSTCCTTGHECQKMAECFSECRPSSDVTETIVSSTDDAETIMSSTDDASTGDCSGEWEQCGGIDWNGPRCCSSGIECVSLGEWYSQCVPGQS